MLGVGLRRRPFLLLIPAATLVGAAGLTAAAVAAVAGPATSASPRPLPDRAIAPAPAGRQATAWTGLVAVETRLNRQHRVLLADEAAIAAITATLSGGDAADLTPARERVVTARLRLLVARHDALAPDYEATLQQEYAIYRSAAESPAAAARLRQASRRAGPAATAAVQGDLGVLDTQLAQEAAISSAETKLRHLGLDAAQRQALLSQDLFIPPAAGAIGQPFGPTAFALEPPLEYHGVFYPHFHTGIDIDAPLDSQVQAAMAGVVALVATSTDGHGHSAGYGKYVVVQHGHGYATLYAHLDKVLVSPGQVVAQGQAIGLVGSTGNSTGPHLHFEIRRDGDFVDPLPYVTGAVRPW